MCVCAGRSALVVFPWGWGGKWRSGEWGGLSFSASSSFLHKQELKVIQSSSRRNPAVRSLAVSFLFSVTLSFLSKCKVNFLSPEQCLSFLRSLCQVFSVNVNWTFRGLNRILSVNEWRRRRFSLIHTENMKICKMESEVAQMFSSCQFYMRGKKIHSVHCFQPHDAQSASSISYLQVTHPVIFLSKCLSSFIKINQ